MRYTVDVIRIANFVKENRICSICKYSAKSCGNTDGRAD